jgi:hypothetical protein
VNESTLIMPEERGSKGQAARHFESRHAWALLGWIGLAFVIVGWMDFGSTWFPTDFGNRPWKLDTVASSFDRLPVLVLGLGLLLTSSGLTDRRGLVALAVAATFATLVSVVGGAILWIAAGPLASGGVPAEALEGMTRSAARTAVQAATYTLLLGFMLWRGVGAARRTVG